MMAAAAMEGMADGENANNQLHGPDLSDIPSLGQSIRARQGQGEYVLLTPHPGLAPFCLVLLSPVKLPFVQR